MMQNGGYFNDVGHYHMHIFPRYKEDGFKWIYPHSVEENFSSQKESAIAIKNCIEKLNEK